MDREILGAFGMFKFGKKKGAAAGDDANVPAVTDGETVDGEAAAPKKKKLPLLFIVVPAALLVLGVVPLGVLLATMAGYALGRLRVPGGSVLFVLLLLGLTLPFEVTIVPLYYQIREMGLLNTRLGLVLPLIGLNMPFAVFWMRAHFATMPRSLIEAARLDGASSWATLWRILLPSSRPAVTTLGVLYFVWSWNQFLLPLILIQDPARRTAPATSIVV